MMVKPIVLLCLLSIFIINAREISYVLDSYEEEALISVNSTLAPYIGSGFLRTFNNNTNTISRLLGETTRHTHNCQGANRISLWYRSLSSATIQLVLFDSSQCDGLVSEHCLQLHKSAPFSLEPSVRDDGVDWAEVSWRFHADTDWLNSTFISLMHIHGYEILVNVFDVLDLDHLACYGGQELLQSHFKVDVPVMPVSPKMLSNWQVIVHNSEVAANETIALIDNNGALKARYTVEKTEVWGGFTTFSLYFPGYLNLSSTSSLAFDPVVHLPADPSGTVALRLVIEEQFSALEGAGLLGKERFYSFHYILDDVFNNATESIILPLEGGPDPGAAFWYTGWSGDVGDRILDRSWIKGFLWEVAMDGSSPDGIETRGFFEINNFRVEFNDASSTDDTSCENELELTLTGEGWLQLTNRIGVHDCCKECEKAENCNFAIQSVERNCAVTSEISPALGQELRLNRGGTLDLTSDYSSMLLMSQENNDFCTICECVEHELRIDCRGRNLKWLPQKFSQLWQPRSLDLRENPYLAVVGKNSLHPLSGGLIQILFPSNIRYLSFSVFEHSPFLKSVDFEAFNLLNVRESEGLFGDVCCVEGDTLDAFQGGDQLRRLSFCEHQGANNIGTDATFLPFKQFKDPFMISRLRTSSLFMRQAAESPEMCAEYCKLNSRCLFFQHDSRPTQSENSCDHYEQVGEMIEARFFADAVLETPGIVSGVAPRARGLFEDARVRFSRSELLADKANSYTVSYEVRLGSMPQRGAVWIEPSLVASDGLNVVISPKVVSLSDNSTVANVTVTIVDTGTIGNNQRTILLTNLITTCDQAFSADFLESSALLVRIMVEPTEDLSTTGTRRGISAQLVVGMSLLMIAISILLGYIASRRIEEQSWKVEKQELKFPNPPIVLGRGTFGLVLLAEWR